MICSIALTGTHIGSLKAQDARVSQYQATPLLINPAQTGDFDGSVRLVGLYSRVSNDLTVNQIYNLSADLKLDQKNRWALGLNYMKTGASNMAINGNYAGMSASRNFYLDHYKLQELRLGVQVSYLQGKVDERKAYDRFLDVGGFRYWTPAKSTGDFKGSAGYLNFSVGAKYKINLERLKIETGFAAYNVTNPDFNIMYDGVLRKRYRVNVLSTINYQADLKNAFTFEHFSWKEGIYLRDYKPSRDTLGIHETTYSLTWHRYLPNKTLNIGLYSRSWQSVYGMLGLNLNENIGVNLSYEFPLYKKYYNVSHLEFSLNLFPFAKKKKVIDNELLKSKLTALIPLGSNLCQLCPVKIETIMAPALQVPVVPEIKKSEEPLKLVFNNHSEVLRSDTIYYDFDRSEITNASAQKLNRVISLLKTHSDLKLEVRSHTDLRGNASYNERLSQRRFISVKAYLQKAGVDSLRIKAGWFGKNQPINDCVTCDDVLQHKNRRSELLLYGVEPMQSKLFSFGSDQVSKEEYLNRIKIFADLDIILPSNPDHTIKLDVIVPGAADLLSWLKALNTNVLSKTDSNGNVSYYFGAFNSEEGANHMLQVLQKLGFRNAELTKLSREQ